MKTLTSRRSLLRNSAATVATLGLGGKLVRAQDAPIRIGVIYDLSGPFAAAGSVPCAIGAQIAIDIVNERGGVAGKYKVQPINADSQSKADAAINEVERLISQEKVEIVLGVYASAHAVPLAAKVEAQKKILWITTEIATSVFKDQNRQYVFRAQIHSDQYGQAFAAFLAENAKAKLALEPKDVKVAIIHEDGPYGVGVAQASEQFAKERGLQIVLREGYSASAPDLSSLVTKLKRAGADVISIAGITRISPCSCGRGARPGCASRCWSATAPATASSTSCAPPSARTSTISATSIRYPRNCSIPRRWRRAWAISPR